MNDLERFLACMEYKPVDRAPNHELGVWPQTVDAWKEQGLPEGKLHFDWFRGEEFFGMDRREFIPVDFGMIPAFPVEVLEKTDRHEVIRHGNGIVTKALLEGTVGGVRMSMDQYFGFPVENLRDFRELKKRYVAAIPERYVPGWEENLPRWAGREHPLILGYNCAACGFYWRAREWMGTENLSLAWYDQPELMHEMMEFFADFTIETARPVLEKAGGVEYFNLNEDFAMKGGPLLGPATFREFIFPHLKRLIEFFKSHGTRYVSLDSDGYPEPLVPLLMDAGVDVLWPMERASEADPVAFRKKFGKSLRLWGGVDKRELAKGPAAIDAHLRELAPLVEEGGYIPTVDHTVPPDVSWENVCYYFEAKRKLLEGRL